MQDEIRALRTRLSEASATVERVDALNALAWAVREVDRGESEILAQRAYLVATEEMDDAPYVRGMVAALRTLGYLHMLAGKNMASLLESERAMALLETHSDAVLEIEVRRNFVWTLSRRGELEQAMSHALKGLGLARDLDDDVHLAMMFDSLGSIYTEAEEYEQAVANDLEALRLYRRANDVTGLATMLNNSAYSLQLAGNYPAALKNATECLDLCRAKGFDGIYITTLGTASELYMISGDHGNALEMLTEYLERAEQNNLDADIIYALGLLGRVFHKQGDDSIARAYIERALERASASTFASEEYKYHALLSEIHEHEGNYPAALEHYKQFHLKKEQMLFRRSRNIANLQVLDSLASAQEDLERFHRETATLQQEIEQRKRSQETLHALAIQDPLTGLFNRRQFKTLAEERLGAAAANQTPVLMLFDLDHFKSVNDTFGHAVGDQVLQTVAQTVRDSLREVDLVARLGGDEFVVLLGDISSSDATRFAERVRAVIQSQPIPVDRTQIHVTISIGVALWSHSVRQPLLTLVQEADQALYHAKRRGRNQTVVWNDTLGLAEHDNLDRMPDILPNPLDL